MRLIVGETPSGGNSEMIQIETNIDDMNPQVFGYVMEKLFAAGALDVYMTPIYMKKNRPATLLGVIARRQDETTLAELILRETTTLGMRVHPIYRYEAQRDFRLLHTTFGDLNVKQKIINGHVVQSMPEYDDCVRLANENGVSLADIYAAVNKQLE